MVSPVIVAYGGTTVVLAVLLRGETLLPAQVVGAVLATAGVVLAAIVFDGGSMRGARLVGPGVAVAIVTMLLFATLTVALAAPDPGPRLAAGGAGLEAGQHDVGPGPRSSVVGRLAVAGGSRC